MCSLSRLVKYVCKTMQGVRVGVSLLGRLNASLWVSSSHFCHSLRALFDMKPQFRNQNRSMIASRQLHCLVIHDVDCLTSALFCHTAFVWGTIGFSIRH